MSSYLSNLGGSAGVPEPGLEPDAALGSSARRAAAPRSRRRPRQLPPQPIADEVDSERLRELAAHLEAVREEERARVAREIHDDLGHQLTTLAYDLGLLGGELGAVDPAIEARLVELRQRCGDIVGSLRRIVTQLRPAVLDDFGLPAAIEWQAGDFARRTGIAVRVEVDESIELDDQSASTVFRIFQEALTNVARHAGAGEVRAALRHTRRAIELDVRDDGRGFDQGITGKRSFGLLGMRERASALGGELEIESSPGRGTRILLRVPQVSHRSRLRRAGAAELAEAAAPATASAPTAVRKLGAA